MMSRTATWATACAALTCVASAAAHHSISMFELGKPMWVKGTVVGYEPVSPHIMIALEQKADDGQVQRLTVEGPGLNSFTRAGNGPDFLKVGDAIEACGFGLKDEILARNSARPIFHGHVLVMPDRQLRLFGGYGKIENCIRTGDQVAAWVEFVNTDQRAHDAWCN